MNPARPLPLRGVRAPLATFAAVAVATLATALFVNPAFSQVGPPRAPATPPPAAAPAPRPPAAAPGGAPAPVPVSGLGAPLTGLTNDQLAAFIDGREDFRQAETPATGLGPIFNDVSCVACHNAGGVGGAGRQTVTRFGRFDGARFDPLATLGGSLLQDRAIAGVPREIVPTAANVVARRVTTPLFGAGLIEAIPDATIAAGAARPKPAGIRGRVATLLDPVSGRSRVGRFGWKAQHATLLAFSADAYLNEMGLTNRLFPTENAPNGNQAVIARFVRPGVVDDVPDPTTGEADIDRVANFMRLLAPPPARPATASSRAGQQLFAALNCADCHTPSLTTGANAIPSLSEKAVPLYSDLLLHDMGSLGDGIEQGAATRTEMRTAPLWGLAARPTWLHDGRANTVDQAIRAHDGEARSSRDRYNQLTAAQRQQLLDFLHTL
jgi:CxxC motif-containing protein (DUF1111 family)